MNKMLSSVSSRCSLVIWTLFCAIAGITFIAYVVSSLLNGHGDLVMPLDDVYIHFQYARQMAAGQPYIYNPGLPATSGATSFFYPYVLAIGYLIGFQGLNLGLWAMAIGVVAMVCAMWLVYKLVMLLGMGDWLAVLVAVAFGVDGPVAWHFMSGMETGLAMLFTLGTLYSVMKIVTEGSGLRVFILWATALVLIRPEGGLLAVIAVVIVWWVRRKGRGFVSGKPVQASSARRWVQAGLVIPVLAVGVQPLVNWLLTGSAVASGNAAKSILGSVPFYWDDVIRRIIGNFVQIWVEFGTGISPHEGLYIMPLLLVVALIGIGLLLARLELRAIGVMLVLWLLIGTAMLATLDTVFWHFKRYQMPFMALLFPLAGWGIGVVVSYKGRIPFLPKRHKEFREEIKVNVTEYSEPLPQPSPVYRGGSSTREKNLQQSKDWVQALRYVIIGMMLVVAGVTSVQFWRYYGLNVGYVYAQPLQMARWLEANTPKDAVVAVHDVGMMRYMGGRTTLDIVGLTTKGAADYWRNGPGAVAEFLMNEKPDYIASYGYGHGYGLGMIADTDIYGKPLVGFPVELDNNANVALAANFQGIYKPDWGAINLAEALALQPSICDNYFPQCSDPPPNHVYALAADFIDVGNLKDEAKHNYQWADHVPLIGFPTETHEFDYLNCYTICRITDSGRRIDGEESFDIRGRNADNSYSTLLVTRIHPLASGTIDIYANDHFVATRWIPELPGNWLEIPTLIPAKYLSIKPENTHIRIVPHVLNNYYMPYNHVVYGYVPDLTANKFASLLATFQDGRIQLGSAELDYQPDQAKLGVNFEWYTDGNAKGDYKVFVHLYADKNQPPVAQLDMRPGNGTLPPGNWLPGVLHDTITVDLKGVPPGKYQVAIGMYDPITQQRLPPSGGDDQNRLFIGEVEIKG